MYPIMLDIRNKSVVLVGGGRIAFRKAKMLVKEGASVTVVSPELTPEFSKLAITWKKKPYEASDLEGAFLIFACTDVNEVNRQVRLDASSYQLVNVTSEQELSDFHNMAIVEEEETVLAISTRGANPSRAKGMKAKLEAWLKEQR